MRVVRLFLLSFLSLTLVACTTTPAEPEKFTAELISFHVQDVPLPLPDMGAIYVPGYSIEFRLGTLIDVQNKPARTSYNFALMGCDDEEYFLQQEWIISVDSIENRPASYAALFYKDSFDELDLPSPLCARILVGKRKIEGKGKGFETVKHPILISDKILLVLPK